MVAWAICRHTKWGFSKKKYSMFPLLLLLCLSIEDYLAKITIPSYISNYGLRWSCLSLLGCNNMIVGANRYDLIYLYKGADDKTTLRMTQKSWFLYLLQILCVKGLCDMWLWLCCASDSVSKVKLLFFILCHKVLYRLSKVRSNMSGYGYVTLYLS